MPMNRAFATALAALVMMVGGGADADAQVRDEWTLALNLGYYDAAPDGIDSHTSFGVSIGHFFDDRWGYRLSAGYVDPDAVEEPGVGRLSWEATFVDLSLHWMFATGDVLKPSLFAGPGWAFVSGRVETPAPGGGSRQDRLSDDSFTVNFGAAVRIDLGEQLFLWPQARWRYFEARDGDELDLEGVLAVGLRF